MVVHTMRSKVPECRRALLERFVALQLLSQVQEDRALYNEVADSSEARVHFLATQLSRLFKSSRAYFLRRGRMDRGGARRRRRCRGG